MNEYVILDVFTQVPLQGNQLAVFSDGSGLTDELMQRTAREMNLSETVFVLASHGAGDAVGPAGEGADARIRIFAAADRLLAALGIQRSGLPVEADDNGALHIYIEFH